MIKHVAGPRSVVLALSLAALVLSGCGSSTKSGGSGMNGSGMNGSGGSGSETGGSASMRAGASGYDYSRLLCSAPASLPGHTVAVTLADMGLTQMMGGSAPMGAGMFLGASPATVPAGEVSLVASNVGWRTHELVILPLAAGAAAGARSAGSDGKVAESASLGEASGDCAAGAGSGIGSGRVSWVTVTLAAGTYELVCNLPNHYADGMFYKLVVT